MKKILCTGGAGCLGAPLVRALVAAGHDVIVLDNESRGRWDRLNGLNIRRWGMSVQDVLSVRGMDCVIHLAAINGTKNFYEQPWKVLDIGINGTQKLLEISVDEGVKEFFFVSSSEVYGNPTVFPTPETHPLTISDPLNPRFSYAASKIAGEMLTLHSGIPRVLIVRPFNIYGPDTGEDHVIPQLIRKMMGKGWLKTDRIEIQGTGEETRSFCHIDDFVSGMLTVLEKGEHRGIYNIGTENEISIRKLGSRIAETEGMSFGGGILETSPIREGSPSRRCPSNAKLKGIGWRQKWALQDGLRETVKWYKEHPVKETKNEPV